MRSWRYDSFSRGLDGNTETEHFKSTEKKTTGPRQFQYADLVAATNNFTMEIGRGGYGIVYKGRMRCLEGQPEVAVKEMQKTGAVKETRTTSIMNSTPLVKQGTRT